MLIYSMSVSLDGYIADLDGDLSWGAPDAELFAFHLARVRQLDAILLGRRLYETMLVWETDPDLPDTDDEAAFAAVWRELPKVVFSRATPELMGNARPATGSLVDEVAAVLDTGRDVEIGGAELAGEAVRLDLVDEFRVFRCPVILGGGAPYLPTVGQRLPLSLVETRVFGSRVVYERYQRPRPGSEG